MGTRLSSGRIVRFDPAALARGGEGAPDRRTLEIGLNSTLGIAAVLMTLGAGAGATLTRSLMDASLPAVALDSAADAPAPSTRVAPQIPASAPRGHWAKPTARWVRQQTPVAPETLPVTAPGSEAPQVADLTVLPTPKPLQLALVRAAIPQDHVQFGAPPVWGRGTHAGGRSGLKHALQSSASGLVDDWSAPEGRDHEVSLFVSSNDEALSWSLSHASPNYGGVAYQKDRVDIGNAAAGLAVSIGDAQVAAAYVQRDVGSNFGGHSQDYGGIILTLRR